MKPIDHMTPDELFEESVKIRKQIVESAEKLYRVYDVMATKARRRPNELSSTFVNISNSGRRFVGSLLHGVRRAEGIDRILDANRKQVQAVKEREAKRLAARAKRLEEEAQQAAAQEEAARKEVPVEKRPVNPSLYQQLFDSSNEVPAIDLLMSQSDIDELYGEE